MKEILIPAGCFLLLGLSFAAKTMSPGPVSKYNDVSQVMAVCPDENYWKKFLPIEK